MLFDTYRRLLRELQKRRTVSVRLPCELVAAISRVAKGCGTTRSDVIREYLVESLPAEYLEPLQQGGLVP